jgi:hypothetical protein
VCLLIFIIGLPVAKGVDRAWRADDLVKTVGEWIRERPALQQARMVATDPRIPFYAGKGADYVRHHRTWSKDYRSLEEVAGQERADLVVLCLPAREKSLVPHFTRYKKLAEFSGRKNIALIYSSPDFRDLVEGKEGD